MKRLSLQLLAATAGIAGASTLECHPEGRIVPRPHHLAKSESFQTALKKLTSTLDGAATGKINGGWDVKNVSVSVGVVSLDQEESNKPLWEYHHLASGNTNGTKEIDRNSQYLIGSVSKVVSDLILLRSDLNIDDPITKYLPTLANSSSLIEWNNITLRALASHLAGMPPNFGFAEYYYLKDYFEMLGFPHLNDSSYGDCGILGLNPGCTEEQLLQGMLKVHPVSEPMVRPVYSSVSFTLFIYALQAHTGKNYTELVKEYVTSPLGMPSTFPSPGDDDQAVIPPIENSWGSDYGDNAPGGGLVSTLADLSALVYSVLDRSALDSPTAVHQWLQPRTFAGSQYSMVGTPWEIIRPPPEALFPSKGDEGKNGNGSRAHTVSIYTKDGAAYGYHSRIAVIDEYGIGAVVMTAGGANAAASVLDAVLQTVIQAADVAAKEETQENGYAVTFVGETTDETGSVPANVTTTLDASSLQLKSVYRNGTDMLEAIREVWQVTLAPLISPLAEEGYWRLYPADVTTEGEFQGKKVIREDWRLWLDVEQPKSDLPGTEISAHNCMGWTITDWIYYGGEPLDRVVFIKDADTGEILGLEMPWLRTGVLERVKLL